MSTTLSDDDLLRERLSRENELARLARMASEAPGAEAILLTFDLDFPQLPQTLPLPLGLRHLVSRYGIHPLGGILELMNRRSPPREVGVPHGRDGARGAVDRPRAGRIRGQRDVESVTLSPTHRSEYASFDKPFPPG